MYDYCLKELPALLAASFPALDTANAGVMGHSMGGHGALVLALRNPATYKSVSAFAPICNPVAVPWGVKAFTGYLGDDTEAWKARPVRLCVALLRALILLAPGLRRVRAAEELRRAAARHPRRPGHGGQLS